uniref:NADH-ubiquinone oxidoreductase chain 4 n=1 Tax=Scrobicularia plana TaxID=665965 RepID=A0A6H2U249_9BIVA|nr:NADH dehydrogenase subunit 4 [Scrobicularia plana]
MNEGIQREWGFVIPMFSVLYFCEMLLLSGYSMSVEWLVLNTSWLFRDYLSISLVSLTVFVVITSLIASDLDMLLDMKWGSFSFMVIMVGVVCILFFFCSDFLPFFFFFESSLIPTVGLILGWGHQPERLQAGLQMIMYTVCGSLPLLVILVSIWYNSGTDNMVILSNLSLDFMGGSSFFWFMLLVGMLVKVPVFFVHGWLPKAHVEAPLSGSMMLAGILLKLGIYGVCRVLWCVGAPSGNLTYFIMSVSLWGGVVCSLLCLCFYDVKSVIAYSSIAHMALSLGGIMSLSSLGWMGGICMAIAHGVCSPCLFSLANYTYMGSGSRSILLCKGLLKSMPALSSMWFLFCVVNMGCPPSINFFSECMLFCSIAGFSWDLLIPLFLLCFLAAGYSLFLYSTVNHGYQSSSLYNFGGLSLRFMISMVASVLVLFGMFLFLDIVFL